MTKPFASAVILSQQGYQSNLFKAEVHPRVRPAISFEARNLGMPDEAGGKSAGCGSSAADGRSRGQ
jgi:hypothetical protein